ncbi:MAG TPA: M20 family metallopeptidase [Jiangellales bacterium]|nr:M20 family metallopeptidase [Jiangellales bacterium]
MPSAPVNTAARPPLGDVVGTLRGALPAMLDDLRALVEVESPTSDHAALGRSADAVSALGERLTGMPAQRLVRNGVPHLRWDLGDGPRRVLLIGHHDTVWPLGTLQRIPWSVADGVVRGPGCFDMKAGLVQVFHALAALGPAYGVVPDGVTVLVTGDEEIGSPSSRSLVEEAARGCRAALVAEGAAPGGAVKVERKGIGGYRLHVTGRAAHAGLEPHLGVNAGVELAHQVLAVSDLADPAAGTTVTPTLSRAGSSANTVPDSAELTLDVRATSQEELDRVAAGLRALRPHLPGAGLRVGGGTNRPPMPAGSAGELLALAGAVAASLELPVPAGAAVGGGSDGNFAAGVGTPTLDGLGAEGGGAHADDEHVVADSLATRAALVAGLVAALLSADPA